MFNLYLIGGIVAFLAIAIPIVIWRIRRGARRDMELDNRREDAEIGKKLNKMRAADNNESTASTRKWLRNKLKN